MKNQKRKKRKKVKAVKVKVKKQEQKKYNRIEASVKYLTSLTGKVPIDKAISGANAVYVKAGGTSNLKEAKYSFGKALKVMRLLNIIRTEDDVISKAK